MEIWGKHGIAKAFASNIEKGAIEQIMTLMNQDFIQGSKVRIMPDVHQGVGCVIGFTAQMGDKIIPNIVGVDLGCGMLTVELGKVHIDFKELDEIIKIHVPAGRQSHEERKYSFEKLTDLHCYRDLKDTKRIERSIGTLGSGNHFIELGVDSNENKYLIIHSGSRNLGKQVAEIYQRLAVDLCSGKEKYFEEKERIIEKYKAQGRRKEIKDALKDLDKDYKDLQSRYPKELCYLTGTYREKYLHDMKIAQDYAILNREIMASIILERLLNKKLEDFEYFHTVHNYIDFRDNIVRKGAIAAYKGEKVIIPINMRDGSILALGKGNEDWNYSAPHGAGRLKSRSDAKEAFTLEDFEKSMEGIYTTSVKESTLDESPFAYKSIEEIMKNLDETVEVIDIIKPIYNFKA
ncbi:RtcB family protein [Tissierella creatinini]|nr:RtcB family protein [Tissierella creatinini]TJX64622.1 RtcB family protein [Soehngenia saccharolytica]